MEKLFADYGMQQQWPAFLESFQEPPARAYRFNALKVDLTTEALALHQALLAEQQVSTEAATEPVPWSEDAYYLPDDFYPGKTLAYRAGLFYIQEASAMLPAAALHVRPGEQVLDLCAAPGGKSARLAADLAGRGLLWSNDINAQRAKVLLRNLEQLGVSNAVVSVATPQALADGLGPVFDRILVDAPCSGEGMFRRDPQASVAWEHYRNAELTEIQADLLHQASRLLQPGGYLLYSTCTFNRVENEEQILAFLASHPDFVTVDARPNLAGTEGLSEALFDRQTLRIWPHKAKGDGHFCCLLKHTGGASVAADATAGTFSDKSIAQSTVVSVTETAALAAARQAFLKAVEPLLSPACFSCWEALPLARWRLEQQRLHLLPQGTVKWQLPAVKFLKTGLYLAELKATKAGYAVKFSHSFAVALHAKDLAYGLFLDVHDPRTEQYLRGETLALSEEERKVLPVVKGELWLPVVWDSHVLGWSKLSGSTAKNLYPPGWRSLQ